MFHQRREEREGRMHDRREGFEKRLHDRREMLEERRHGRYEGHEEHRHDRREEHEEHRHDRRDRHHQLHRDQDQPQYAAPSGGLNRADFVSDEEFRRMMHGGGGFEKPRLGGDHIGPEDYGEWDRSRPTQNAGYQKSYLQQSEPSRLRFPESGNRCPDGSDPEPPLSPIPHEQRTSGYESGPYSQPSRNEYFVPESLEPRHGSNVYAPPAGPLPGALSSHAPAGGYAPHHGAPPQVRPSCEHEASPRGGLGRGAVSDYYNGPPPGQLAQSYSHSPDNTAAHSDPSNPVRYQPHPSGEFDEEVYKSHFSTHAQAHGSGYDDKPMTNDDIGTAAAIEALKITAANNQSGVRPQQGGRPQGGFQTNMDTPHARPSANVSSGTQHSSDMSGRPSGGKPQGRPQNAESEYEQEDEELAAKPHAPTGGGGAQDKIIALAMAQAGKLIDKKGGGDNQGKTQGRFSRTHQPSIKSAAASSSSKNHSANEGTSAGVRNPIFNAERFGQHILKNPQIA